MLTQFRERNPESLTFALGREQEFPSRGSHRASAPSTTQPATPGGRAVPRRFHLPKLLLLLSLLYACQPGLRAEPTTFPQAARDRYEQGKELQKQGRNDEALAAFEEARRLGMMDYPRLYLGKAISHEALRAHDAAIAQYNKIIDEFGMDDSCRH
jgi:tetratricopeptide (TPR) repeat protein